MTIAKEGAYNNVMCHVKDNLSDKTWCKIDSLQNLWEGIYLTLGIQTIQKTEREFAERRRREGLRKRRI